MKKNMGQKKSKCVVYETVNKVNDKKYIGVTSLDNFNKGYIGCGVTSDNSAKSMYRSGPTLFRRAVIKYGYESFESKILHTVDTFEEAYDKEKELVNQAWVDRRDTYNMITGGVNPVTYGSKTKLLVYDNLGELKGWTTSTDYVRITGGEYSAKVINNKSLKGGTYKELKFIRTSCVEGVDELSNKVTTSSDFDFIFLIHKSGEIFKAALSDISKFAKSKLRDRFTNCGGYRRVNYKTKPSLFKLLLNSNITKDICLIN